MADVAYTRLLRSLLAISEDGKLPEGVGFPAVFLDAWSVVDSVHRLRTLVRYAPGLANSPPKEVFSRATDTVEDLRNAVQHLTGEYVKDSTEHDLPWGRVLWVAGPKDGGALTLRLMVAGACTMTRHEFVNPCGQRFYPPIDKVSLDAHGLRMDLSETMRAVQSIAKHLEAGWREAIGPNPVALGSDLTVSLDLHPGDAGPAPKGKEPPVP